MQYTSWLDVLPDELREDIFRIVHRVAYRSVVRDIDELVDHEYYPEFGVSELIITSRHPVIKRRFDHGISVNYSMVYPSRLLEVWNWTDLQFDKNTTHEQKTYLA